MVAQLVNDFDLPHDKIDMVPNGVVIPPNPFACTQDRQHYRMRYQPFDAPLLFAVGRLVHEKGWHVLIAALAHLRHTFVHTRLVLAGVGGYRDELQWLVRQYDVLSAFTFAGFISDDDRNKLYASADIAVFPSLYEPFGIVALEAMALRCPVVVSNTGGLREVVQSNRTGVLVSPDNVDALVAGLTTTLSEPVQTNERIQLAFEDTRMTYG